MYLFHALLGDISNHCYLPSLSHSVCPANRLFFDRRVPLRLDKVDSISDGQREAIKVLVYISLLKGSGDDLGECLATRGTHPTEPVWIDMSKTWTEGSCLNRSRCSSRSDVPTRPSIRKHRIPLSPKILCSESRVLNHDVKMRLPRIY